MVVNRGPGLCGFVRAVGYSLPWRGDAMEIADFRRLALALEGAEEGSHMGAADFRVGGRIFATLAMQSQGYGNLMITPEMQAEFVEAEPEVFLAIPGGWGRNGATHLALAKANEDLLAGALRMAWKLRREMNDKVGSKRGASAAPKSAAKKSAAKKSAAKKSVAKKSAAKKSPAKRVKSRL
jgi:hypothetical protein